MDEKQHLLLAGNKMTVDLATVEDRNAARMFAYTLIAQGDTDTAKLLLGIVGREG